MTRFRAPSARSAWLGAGIVLIAACSAPSTRPPPAPPVGPAPTPAPPAAEPSTAAAPAVPAVADASPWPRLRARFALPGCDYRPEVQRQAREYTRNPKRFAATWQQAMPFLLLVVDELDRRDLPGEFAMLPYVESLYQPIPATGNRPAGMWQLMPDTARGGGLAVGSRYDTRLDALASTRVALDLIERYDRQFADWRLADMAFNSGESRVRKLLGGRDASTFSAAELAALPFNPTTHEHLDRVLALACIIDDPQRFSVELPEPTDDDYLLGVPLEAGMDLRLAARLAGVELDDLKRWNAGYLNDRMPENALHRLLLPANRAGDFLAARETVPTELWGNWRVLRTSRSNDIASWAAQLGVPVNVLAMANGVDEDGTIAAATTLLLPGRETERDNRPARAAQAATRGVHTIAPGDTLSGIAQRYGMPLKRLKQLNPQAKGILHPGQSLRVRTAGG